MSNPKISDLESKLVSTLNRKLNQAIERYDLAIKRRDLTNQITWRARKDEILELVDELICKEEDSI